MLPTLARGAALLGDAGSRGLYGGPLTAGAGSTQAPRPSGDKNNSASGGATTSSSVSASATASATAASTTATSAVATNSSATATILSAHAPSSSSVYLRTHSRFNFARPSFELSRRGSVDASAVASSSSKKAVGNRRPFDLAPLLPNDEDFASTIQQQQQESSSSSSPLSPSGSFPPSSSSGSPSSSASSTSSSTSSSASSTLPAFLTNLLDPSASVDLPPGPAAAALRLDNRELDKLVAALGRSRATWRRALMLHEWLLAAGHALDCRLATTLLRAASQHGAAVTALGLYDWMRAPVQEGGAGLQPTVFTYTAAMRAALAGGLLDRALQVWDDAARAGCAPDCRMATALVEVSARRGDTDRALAAYAAMRDAPRGSRLSPSVHAYTAAMRAAAEGGRPEAALRIWDDLEAARNPSVRPTGHAYAAAISACAAAGVSSSNGTTSTTATTGTTTTTTATTATAGTGDWRRAVRLFEAMLRQGIKPDVVSCTALVAALGGAGRADDAAAAVKWMLEAGVRPNVRTYTALLSAQAGARRWDLALDTLARMKGETRRRGGGGSALSAIAAAATNPSSSTTTSPSSPTASSSSASSSAFSFSSSPPSSSSPASDAAAAAAAAGATGVEPNAYTYSALIKAAGEQGQWRLAEAIFGELEREALREREARAEQQRAVAAEVAGGGGGGGEEVKKSTTTSAAAAAATAAAGAKRPPSSSPSIRFRSSIDINRRDSIELGSFGIAKRLAEEVLLDGFDKEVGDDAAAAASSSSSSSSPSSSASAASSNDDTSATALPRSSSAAALSRFSWAAAAPASAVVAASDASNPWGGGGGVFIAAEDEEEREERPLSVATAAAWRGATADDASASASAASAASASNSNSLNRPPALLNEVVCGALMAAHERAGRADDAVRVLDRAAALGVAPNAVMFNTALAALGRRGRFDEALALFEAMPIEPDAVAHETLVAAAGVAGRPRDAEAAFARLLAAGHAPRDYAFCGLIAAHSAAGDLASALGVRERYAAAAAEAAARAKRQQQQQSSANGHGGGVGGLLSGVRSALSRRPSPSSTSPAFAAVAGAAAGAAASAAAIATPPKPSVHVYNALLAACERARAWDEAVKVADEMRRDGVPPDADTARLLSAVGKGGVNAVEDAQLAAAALSAALAAAGGLLMRSGIF